MERNYKIGNLKYALRFYKHMQFLIFVICASLWASADIRTTSDFGTDPDSLQIKDLQDLLEALKTVSNYYIDNRDIIDTEALFGLTLVNVNLEHVLNYKQNKLLKNIQSIMQDVITSNERLITYALKRLRMAPEIASSPDGHILTLFDDVTQWTNRLQKFRNATHKKYTKTDLLEIYSDWKKYEDNFFKYFDAIPGPTLSDRCLIFLSQNPVNKVKRLALCPIDEECSEMLTDGTNFGYALAHRIILLLMARLGRGCHIFSPQRDTEMLQEFCTMAFAEAQYVALHDYVFADFFFELICLCALDGHSQFMNRDWVDAALSHQTTGGCFGEKFGKSSIVLEAEGRPPKKLLNLCTNHITAVGSGVLASAVRFISEVYY